MGADTYPPYRAVPLSNPVRFRAYQSANSTVAVGWSVLVPNLKNYDPTNAYNPANGQVVLPVGGLFHVFAGIHPTLNNNPQRWTLSLVDWAVTTEYARGVDLTARGGVGGDEYQLILSDVVSLSAGNYCFRIFNNGGNTTPLVGGSHLTYVGMSQIA